MKRILIILILFSVAGCDEALLGEDETIVSLDENLSIPAVTEDDWEVSSLAEQNVDVNAIQSLIRKVHAEPRNVHSFLLVRNNKLLVDAYFAGWHKERPHDLRSASKSINSTLIGIAIHQGFIEDVEQNVFDFFPQYQDLKNTENGKIRIDHLLTMTSGLKWDQSSYPNEDNRNDEGAMERSRDWLRYTLERKMIREPGTTFLYNSGCSNLLAGIIKSATGDHADKFAEKHLFASLNITDYFWRKQDDGLCNAAAGLFLRPRDMAKIGQLFLDKGMWHGQQIISEAWVHASTAPFLAVNQGGGGYGYQWWTQELKAEDKTIKFFLAAGNGGQYIFVIPALQAVVVFTGGNYAPLNQSLPHTWLRDIILPALQ